jgi:hypothetical protein
MERPASTPDRAPRWPLVLLALAMVWVALVRVPLVLNAAIHLDSDLAVDGLTLLDATHGHWRWHYPATPHMGIGPVLLSWPQAMAWGAGPITLVSGGVVAYEAIVLATFLLAWKAFGPRVAAWSLVPLAFASTGVIWLSGRITGGHLLTAAWHAGAFALMYDALSRGGVWRAAILGLWCGVGLYLDTLFAFTVAGMAVAAVAAWGTSGVSRRGALCGLAFVLMLGAGALPREIGRWADPYDAYGEQFAPVRDPSILAGHARLLVMECLPRLVAGHTLPDLRSEPAPASLGGRRLSRSEEAMNPVAWAATALGLAGFALALGALAWASSVAPDPARRAVGWGLLLSSSAVMVAFVVNKNIFNSDNYRYLVILIVPGALGFGLAMEGLARRGRGGALLAGLLSAALAVAMTADAAQWYGRFGWIGPGGRPARGPRSDPALQWLREHPDVTHVFGSYWDVYRLAFLSGERVRAVPYPTYPNRFEGWSRGLGPGRGRMLVVRPDPNWRRWLADVWRRDGRPDEELRGVAVEAWPRARGGGE